MHLVASLPRRVSGTEANRLHCSCCSIRTLLFVADIEDGQENTLLELAEAPIPQVLKSLGDCATGMVFKSHPTASRMEVLLRDLMEL